MTFMKRLLSVFVVFYFSISTAQAVELNFTLSETHGLVKFVDILGGGFHRVQAIENEYVKSKFNNSKSKEMLKKYKKILPDLRRGLSFNGYPSSRRNGVSFDKVLLIQSAYSKDLDDLQTRIGGLVPLNVQDQLFKVYTYFSPIYKEILWEPNLKKLNKHRSELVALAKKSDIDESLSKAAKFYRSDWPEQQDFLVALYPIPGSEGASKAESLGAVESVSMFVDEVNYGERLGVVFHEFCHSLYKAQSKETQKWFVDTFQKVGTDNSKLAYNYINEGIATALGNGWFEKKVTGVISKKPWYNNKYIEGYSRVLYPLVTKYMEVGKPMDDKFIKDAISLYKKVLPDSHLEFDAILAKIILGMDGETFKSQETGSLLRKNFRVWGMSRVYPINSSESLGYIFDAVDTRFLVFSGDSIEQLKPLKKKYSFLRKITGGASKILTHKKEGQPAIIALKIEDMKELNKALKNLKKMGKLSYGTHVFEL